MSTIKKSITIPKDVSTRNDLDFEFLKKTGIEYIESMGGGLWTDYNEHDPGITMLEMLAYAITDLGNRIDLPMSDLLTTKDDHDISKQFYKAADILPNKAVTALDYRKILIDLDGVRNCWIMPYDKMVHVNCRDGKLSYKEFKNIPVDQRAHFQLKGLNKILVDFDLEESIQDDPVALAARIAFIKGEISRKYHENRNLCEDLIDINEVGKHPISICADIEIEPDADEDVVHANVLFAIQSYFSPTVHFYSLKQMLDKGYRIEEIFEGPLLENGFIDTAELRKAGLRSEVRLSDIMQLISDVKGVKLIKDITIGNCSGDNNPNDWLICIEQYTRPVLCDKSSFTYQKNVIPVTYSRSRVDALLAELISNENAFNAQAKYDMNPQIPEGEYLDTDYYTTIQNDFPEVYGIGLYGLKAGADTARKSKAKQLKGYLLFFDQILGSYFAHLGKVRELLSVERNVTQTYFTQAIKDVTGLSELVNNYPEHNDYLLSEELFKGLDNAVERRNQILDHLLARFAESFTNYAFLMKEIYGTMASDMTLRSKEAFLKEYVELSSNRGRSFDYWEQDNDQLWDTGNVSGVEKRIARLSGMKNYFRRNLSTSYADIYEFSASPLAYKWKIKNKVGHTILSSVREYDSIPHAANELYQAVLLMIETSEEKIKDVFEQGVIPGTIVDNVELLKSGSGNYYFKVINPDITNPLDPDRVVARQHMYFPLAEGLEKSVLSTIEFMKYDFTDEGAFVVENILLRPDVKERPDGSGKPINLDAQFLPVCAEDCGECCSPDPYSFRVSFVLPGFTERFSQPAFRIFMENLIREEMPSHIIPKICWIGQRKGVVPDNENQLMLFETAYREFLESLTDADQQQDPVKLEKFTDILMHLHTIYPTGRLHACDDDEQEGKIILGRTKLGTL